MPVIVNDVLEQAEGLAKALDNHKDQITSKGNGQKRIDDLNSTQQDLIKANSSQVAAETFMQQKTSEKSDAIQAAKDAIALVDDAAKSAFEGDKTTLKEFRMGVAKPKSEEGWVTFLDYMTGPVQKHRDDLIANGLTPDDIANVSTVYANLVAAIAVQKNAAKVRNAATKSRDAAVSALSTKITATRNFAKVALKDDKGALEEIKPIKTGGRKTSKPAPQK